MANSLEKIKKEQQKVLGELEGKKQPISSSKREKESFFDRIKEDLSRRKEGVSEKYKKGKESVHEKYKKGKEHVHKKYKETKEKASTKLGEFYDYLREGNIAFFIYFAFVCILIFTFTLITVYNNKKISGDNPAIMKNIQGFYIFGIIILSIFLIALSWSFGEDKKIAQK